MRAQAAFTSVTSFEQYSVIDDEVFGISKLSGAPVADISPIKSLKDKLWAHLEVQFYGERLGPNMSDTDGRLDPENRLAATVHLNAAVGIGGFGWDGWLVTARVNDILDAELEHSGAVPHAFPQPGGWVSANLQLKFY